MHPDKNNSLPSKEITYLGFIFESASMFLSVTYDKKEKIQNTCFYYLEKESLKIRQLANIIGTLKATFPRKKSGSLYYIALHKSTTLNLR